MLPLPTETTTEEKQTLVRNDAIPRTTEDHKLFEQFEFKHQNTS